MIKVFGIGNILLCDDGVGVSIGRWLQGRKLGRNIEVIIGETDYMYCLDNINDGDYVIIIDSTYFEITPGRVTKMSFSECDDYINDSFAQHEESLLKVLRREYRHIDGCLIGIEIGRIGYGMNLSREINNRFEDICYEVEGSILKAGRKISHA